MLHSISGNKRAAIRRTCWIAVLRSYELRISYSAEISRTDARSSSTGKERRMRHRAPRVAKRARRKSPNN
jgi:hypothetical protein